MVISALPIRIIWALPEYCSTMITISTGSRNSAIESRAST